jgi:hypothetical protein
MGNEQEQRLEYGRAEVLVSAEWIIKRAMAVEAMGAAGDLERLRKVTAADELLADVVLFASGVRELLEEQGQPSGPRVLALLEDLEGDEDLGPGDLIEREDLAPLRDVCLCGVERGDHLVGAPQGTEDGKCTGFVLGDRSTERPLRLIGDTEPPPAMAAP